MGKKNRELYDLEIDPITGPQVKKVFRMAGVEGEEALHCACDKFVRRFAAVERTADKPLGEYTQEELLKLWADTKES